MKTMSSLFLLFIQTVLFLGYSNCANLPKVLIKVPPSLVPQILEAIAKCEPETSIGWTSLLNIVDGKYRQDETFKNFLYCSYKTSGFLRDDGHINEDKALAPFKHEPLVVEGVKRCGQEKGKDAKETLFLFFKCFVDTTQVKFVI